jgi:hypothetical protein
MRQDDQKRRGKNRVLLATGHALLAADRERITKATEAYCTAANALDADSIIAMLAENVSYESQWVFESLTGQVAVGDHIKGKYQTIRQSETARPLFQLGLVDLPFERDYPVALVTQFGKTEAFIALTIDAGGQILRHEILGEAPHVSSVRLASSPGQSTRREDG